MADRVLMSFTALADAVSGRTVGPGLPPEAGFSSVCIDSRIAERGSLFVALAGNVQDGHRFLPDAFAKGARAALVSRSRMEADGAALTAAAAPFGALLIVVENTLTALQAAAAAYLDGFGSLLRVGITGSSGKTTTKELAAAMVGAEKRVVMNAGNLNSETGLPLSVFAVREEHEVGIFELGMNRVGEIGELASVLRPHIALVTNVGSAHIGILGSRDAIAKEKKDIFSRFSGSQAALIPETDAYSSYLAEGVQGRVRAYGPGSLSAFGGEKSLGLDGSEVVWAGVPARLALPGRHNVLNALAAAAIAEEVGVGPKSIRRGMETAAPLFGRGEILRGEVTVVRDCYNANPEATEAAIEFCDSVEWQGRRVYVIGSMLELGADSLSAHRRICRALAESKADSVFLFGAGWEEAETELASAARSTGRPDSFRTEAIDELIRAVSESRRPGDLVLLKGSRLTALERLTGPLLGASGHEGV